LADYREHYPDIRSAGADVIGISVDPPEKSEALRIHLSLPFLILCDAERRVVRDWDIYNSREKGGIAKPAVFIIDPGPVVRYAAVGGVLKRVPAAEIISSLLSTSQAQPARRRAHIPRWPDWRTAIRNLIQR
jgi:peroxiredoxin